MNFTTYKGKKVAYTQEGKGSPILLLHGFCEDSRMWEEFAPDLLEEGFQVIRIDLPGFGQSEVDSDTSIEDMAKAVQQVLQEVQSEPVVLIGHSMGGYVGLALARLYPESLSGLGLFHSHPYADPPEKQAERFKSIDFIERQGTALFVKQLLPKLFTPNFARSNTFLLEKLIYRASKFEAGGITAAQKAMAERPDESKTLAGTELPVLFIVGQEDAVVPEGKSAEQLTLPAVADVHLLPRVGHMGMFEARKKTQLIVRHFATFCVEQGGAKNAGA